MILELTFVFAIAGHGADLASTEHCLGARTCTELNPWLVRYSNPVAFGISKMAVAGISEVFLYKYSKTHPKVAGAINLLVGSTFTAIAIRNTHAASAIK